MCRVAGGMQGRCAILQRMTDDEIASARADIEATTDLLERAMKLSGLVTTLFQERGFPLVVVGGSAVEFYTEGGYMSGDIDFCRKTRRSVPPRLMQEQEISDALA